MKGGRESFSNAEGLNFFQEKIGRGEGAKVCYRQVKVSLSTSVNYTLIGSGYSS